MLRKLIPMHWVLAIGVLSLSQVVMTSAVARAAAVVVGDKQWRQVTDTSGLSWNQVAGVCNSTTGACSGTIGAISFNGWTWASLADVRALFEQLILPGTTQFTSDTGNYVPSSSPDIDAAIDPSRFLPNFKSSGTSQDSEAVFGFSRTLLDSTTAYAPFLQNYYDNAHGQPDFALLGAALGTGFNSPYQGSWFYQPAPVPLPAAAWLLMSGLGGVAAFARRRTRGGSVISTQHAGEVRY